MSKTPPAVAKRLISAVPKFKKILEKAKERDVNESDTVTIITDMLEEVFGFDKYSEITREYSIKGKGTHYCDLVIKTANAIEYLIEVKAIGLTLQDNHLKQAVNYASRAEVKWIVLTNGIKWEIYRVIVEGKVESEKLFEFDFTEINPKQVEKQDLLFLLCKRGVQKDLIDDYYEYKQSVNHYIIGALLLTESVTNVVCKELKKLKTGIKVDTEEIKNIIHDEIIKREILDSASGIEAKTQVSKFLKKQEKVNKQKKIAPSQPKIVPQDGQ